MKPAILFASAALAASALGQSSPLTRIQTRFDFVVHAPLDQAMPLFGPEGERAWAGIHWDPQFLFPQPAADVEGAVFTVAHGPLNAVWVNTLFDQQARHFQYVYFLPGIMVTVIDVRFAPCESNATTVSVTYTRTALTPQGNEHVKAMSDNDKTSGPDWEHAIAAHLARSGTATKP